MTTGRVSRRDALLGVSAATLAGLAGCNGSSSPFSGIQNSGAPTSPWARVLPAVDVSTPTGEAIQDAINGLPPGGGTVNLTADVPYVIDTPLLIERNKVQLVGRGPAATRLRAKSGAVLTVSGYSEEYLLLVSSAANVGISQMTIDTYNQANSPGEPRLGIGVWSSNSIALKNVTFVHNLGPNGLNQSLGLNQSTGLTIENCEASESRIGISLSQCSNFKVINCQVNQCQSYAPSYPGPTSAIAIVESNSGIVNSCLLQNNRVNSGIFIKKSASVQIQASKIYKTLGFSSHLNPGILVQGCTGAAVVLVRCTVLDNSGSGIGIANSTAATIRQCSLANNGSLTHGAGISLDGGTSQTTVQSNNISDNRGVSFAGIKAGESSGSDDGAVVTDSTVRGFGTGVDLGSNSSNCLVKNNDLRHNTNCFTNSGSHNTITGNLC